MWSAALTPRLRRTLSAACVGLIASAVLGSGVAARSDAGQPLLPDELWGVLVTPRVAPSLVSAAGRNLRDAGVNTLIVNRQSFGPKSYSRVSAFAARWQLTVINPVRSVRACRPQTICAVSAGTSTRAMELAFQPDVDVVVVGLMRPIDISGLSGAPATSRVLAVAKLGSKRRLPAAWRNAVQTAHRLAATDFAVAPQRAMTDLALTSYLFLLSGTKFTSQAAGTAPPTTPAKAPSTGGATPKSAPVIPPTTVTATPYAPPGAVGAAAGSPANVFVSTGGNDSGSCTQAAPCASLNRAYQVARPGQVAEVAGGTYPPQEIAYDASKTSDPVTLRAAPGATVQLGAKASITANLTLRQNVSQTIPVTSTAGFVIPGPVYLGQLSADCTGATSTNFTGCTSTDSKCTDGVSCTMYAGAQIVQSGLRFRGTKNVVVQDMNMTIVTANNSHADGTMTTGSLQYASNVTLSRVSMMTIWTRGADHLWINDSEIGNTDVSLPGIECGAYAGQPQTSYLTISDSDIHNITSEKANLGPGYGGNHVGAMKWDACNNVSLLRNRWWHNDIYNILMKDTIDAGGSCNRHDILIENNWFDGQWNGLTGLRGGAGAAIMIQPPAGCTFSNIDIRHNTFSGGVMLGGLGGTFSNSSFAANITYYVTEQPCSVGFTFRYNIYSSGSLCGTGDQTGVAISALFASPNVDVPDFTLLATATSALGKVTTAISATDISGNARGNPADVGASER